MPCPLSVAPLPAWHASHREQRGQLPVPDLPCCHNSSDRAEGGWTRACRDYVEIGRKHWKWHSVRWNGQFSELEFLEIVLSFVGRSESSLGSDARGTLSWEWMDWHQVSAPVSSCSSSLTVGVNLSAGALATDRESPLPVARLRDGVTEGEVPGDGAFREWC